MTAIDLTADTSNNHALGAAKNPQRRIPLQTIADDHHTRDHAERAERRELVLHELDVARARRKALRAQLIRRYRFVAETDA